MNKSAIATIIATAALSIAKKALGSKNQGITVKSIDELIKHANDPKLALLVTELDINLKGVTKIPSEIGKLINLKYISLGENQITSIPPEIGNLKNLESIILDKNQITSIPPEIGNLTNLKAIRLDGNKITSIPPEIENLENLEWLRLEKNQITSIPPEIGSLSSLRYLDLASNQIDFIPSEIGNLRNLSKLIIKGNPGIKIHQSVLNPGSKINPVLRHKLRRTMRTPEVDPFKGM